MCSLKWLKLKRLTVCVGLVTQSCLNLCYIMSCSLSGSSVLGIFQARLLEWVAMSSSRGSSQPRDETCVLCFLHCVSCIGRWILYHHCHLGNPIICTVFLNKINFQKIAQMAILRGSTTTTNDTESESLSVVSDSLQSHRLYSPWNSSGQNTVVGSLSFSRGSSQPRSPKHTSPALQVDSLPSEPLGKPKNTGMVSLSLLQWIFLTQESNWGLLHCRWILYQLSYQGSPTKTLIANIYWMLTLSPVLCQALWLSVLILELPFEVAVLLSPYPRRKTQALERFNDFLKGMY